MKNWMEKLVAQFKNRPAEFLSSPPDRGPPPNKAMPQPELSGSTAHNYSSDQPIRSKTEDRFNRWPFAKRIADTFATRRDPASLVVGLYGPWGDGKTSTLHLMEEALAEHGHVVVVRFNPWLFQSEELLLRGFFATLAEALGKALPRKHEELGNLLKRYGMLLSVASISIGGVVQIKAGEAVKGLGEALSTVEIDELRSRVEQFLEESGRRVVVLIDDIDRLDRAETQGIFKLVKLSAGFNHTSCVLSFDDEIVAAAIGEKYGQGGIGAGRAFLEKIIQVPLHLPPPDEMALRTVTFEGVDAAVSGSGITLSQEQMDAFVRHFVDGLEPQLGTPRHAKLYVNAITFALPLLKGEVHPVDLMLLEGVRTFYPKLYRAIRDNPEYFLKGAGDNHQQREARRQRVGGVIDEALEGIGVRDKDQVRKRLLEVLFPRLGNMGYGPEWDKQWAREQRICSEQYFKRYFTYSVPPGDVSDTEVTRLTEQFASISPEIADGVLKGFAERAAMPQLVRKLRNRENEIQPASAQRLASAVARNGALLPRERGMFTSDLTFRQSAILVAQLLRRIPSGPEREAAADEIFQQAQGLPFAFECLRWVRHDAGQPEADRIIAVEAEGRVANTLASRIRSQALESPLYQGFGADAPALYWLWNKHSDGSAVQAHLRSCFQANPAAVDNFLESFVGYAWGMESGLPHRADFDRGSYDAVAKLIEPDFIVTNLKQRYGAQLDTPQFHHSSETSLACRIAHQFTFIHLKVQEEKVHAADQA